MGAGFTDQGFAEHFFALQHKNLYSVSHRTCKLKYVHFNMPPKQTSVSRISGGRGSAAVSRHLHESSPGEMAVGGLVSEFEAVFD